MRRKRKCSRCNITLDEGYRIIKTDNKKVAFCSPNCEYEYFGISPFDGEGKEDDFGERLERGFFEMGEREQEFEEEAEREAKISECICLLECEGRNGFVPLSSIPTLW